MDGIVLEENKISIKAERAYSKAEIENMVKQYGNMVFRLAFVKMKQKEQADDVFQDVFIKLIKLRNRLDSCEHEKAWMIKTTVNCCKDVWKSAWVRCVMYQTSESTNNDSKMVERDDSIYALVLKLSDKYRVIVHLFYYEEFTANEISQMLKMNINTVLTRLKRAREILKKEMIQGGYDYEV